MRNRTGIKLELPNIDYSFVTKGIEQDARVIEFTGIHEVLHPAIEALATKHPDWKFTAVNTHGGLGDNDVVYRYVHVFEIYKNKEKLGRVSSQFSYGRGKEMIEIHSHRVDADTQRGSGKQTSDPKKAVKIVEKYFDVKSMQEKFTEAKESIGRNVTYAYRQEAQEFHAAKTLIDNGVQAFIFSNMEAFVASLPVDKRAIARELPERIKRRQELEILHEEDPNKVFIIMVEDSVYVVNGKQQTNEELSEHVRRGLGLLKLVDECTYIQNIGLRAQGNDFILLGENNDVQS